MGVCRFVVLVGVLLAKILLFLVGKLHSLIVIPFLGVITQNIKNIWPVQYATAGSGVNRDTSADDECALMRSDSDAGVHSQEAFSTQ